MYDNEDSVCGIIYNDTPYYFQKNLQGDVIAIIDKNANVVARYTYDAWGECTATPATGIAAINPFRYRGYYYDSEIGMYYLQSRYYDPKVGRFINADDVVYFVMVRSAISSICCYCQDDPVNDSDYNGYVSEEEALKVIDKNKKNITEAAKKFGINPVALGCTIFAEQYLNVDFKGHYIDPIAAAFLDVSLGVSQVLISTAMAIEDKGYMPITVYIDWHGNNAVNDHRTGVINKLLVDSTNIEYAAAYLRWICDVWKSKYPKIWKSVAIMATCYNLGRTNPSEARSNPISNDFGRTAQSEQWKVAHRLGVPVYQS